MSKNFCVCNGLLRKCQTFYEHKIELKIVIQYIGWVILCAMSLHDISGWYLQKYFEIAMEYYAYGVMVLAGLFALEFMRSG